MGGARFHDGKTAQAHDVAPRVDGGSLIIATDEGTELARWPLVEVDALDRVAGGDPLRLACSRDPEARLIVVDPGLAALVAAAVGASGGAWRRRWATARRWLIGLVATAAAAAVGVVALPHLVRGVVAILPPAWEMRIGDAVVQSLLEDLSGRAGGSTPRCVAPEGRAALDALVARLAEAAQAPYPFRVEVVEMSMVNALTVPGGRIVVLSGLIDQAQSAEELAGVLAHEMGHGIERHPMQAAVRFLVLRALAQTLAGGESDRLAAAAALWANFSYGREDERAADRHAAAILDRTGIGTRGLVEFFRRLAAREEKLPAWASVLSSHPASADRAAELGEIPSRKPALGPAQWAALRAICGHAKTTPSAGLR